MAKLSIGDVAKQAGVRTSAIRYYEERGLIPQAEREGGRRIYDPDVLDRLAVIELAKGAGFTLRETHVLLANAPGLSAAEGWGRQASAKLIEIEAEMERLSRMKEMLARLADCGCPTLDACGRAMRHEPQGEAP